MIRKIIVLLVITLIAFPGYGADPEPVTALYLRAEPPVVYQFIVHGGRYFVEVKTVGPVISSVNSHSLDDGKGMVKELFEFTWGYSGKGMLRIEDGKLTVNGKDRGMLASGDRIKMTARGKLLVNDTKR